MQQLLKENKITWIKIIGIYILSLFSLCPDYSFLYTNERIANALAWIDPAYLMQFLLIGVIGCICLCRQQIKEFSGNIFNFESLIILLCNMIFVLFVMLVGRTIGQYEINWLGVLNRSIYCYIFVGITEEWIYRGFIVTQMKKVIKSTSAIVIISAIMFALAHLPAYFVYTETITLGGVLYRLLIPLILGLVYAHIYLCNGNLFVVIVLHGTYNLIENIAFEHWYYVAYGICLLLMFVYVVFCYKKGKNTCTEK